MTNFKDHFSEGSTGYAAHRPTYPIGLVDELAAISPGQRLALDCGCGNGQLSVLLAERFERVEATDASAAQIAQAQPHPRVHYRTALAERSGLPDASADLITVAQAAHWFDLDAFYAEARRVARPNAVLALITYGRWHVDGDADPIVQHFYKEVIAPYWPPERRHVEEGYRTLPFPFREIVLPPLTLDVAWRLEDVIGYVRTWSAVRAARQALGRDPVEGFAEDLGEAWGDPDVPRQITWPLSLRIGHIESALR
ncbi:class I SAM-dependent methyltransferase [Sphingobium estronivorans]|uniref:class I SAM-dependent methyltransferase n=1 Tax=Sphingobium estronivorans TaxID=1577690 RepID=UPI00123BB323|nr:class I SAM-dependent methyltransferase [Sphingobium estronivorans]